MGLSKVGQKEWRSVCPVARTLEIFGDKWTLLVVRDLILGRHLFREFQASPEGIATNILSDRLSRLVRHGLVERYPSSAKVGTDAYRLTAKGESLEPVVRAIADWGLANIEGAEEWLKEKRP